jgi:2-polyprenyl-3-methyl-5-hydroxy-6-metoxy-1,4-benzoquinol methylase
MEDQPNSKINQFVKNPSGAKSLEGIETSKIWGHLTSTWGMGERVIPKIMGDDSASQRIVEISFRHYETAARYVKGKRVLDIACGSGYGSQMLRLAGASSVLGVDVCADTVQYAREHYQISGIEFICADAEQFQSSERFDVIVSYETIEHLHYPLRFLENIHKLLVPGGDFLLSMPLGETRHFDPYHLHAFSQQQVFTLLKTTGFLIDTYRCDELFISRTELSLLGEQFPLSNPSIRDLFLTGRGWQAIYDYVCRGGFHISNFLVVSRSSNC